MIYKLFFDGCSKGNPGKSGCGYVIYDCNNNIYSSGSIFVGNMKTNNISEYSGMLAGMKDAIDKNIKEINVYGDSKLVICQMNGTYKVKSFKLIELYKSAKNAEKKFTKISYTHIDRNKNTVADKLANDSLI